ncbi:hypothetical protein [Bacillus toyonensis]|uniref:hypothetical protein n=1 Tax=Bacillus toyonensis TaxID=155322 RepID=UPI001144ACC2|nr:hypothetical protein [Bacillus toyonensis]
MFIMNLIKSDSKWIDYCAQIILEKNDNKLKGEILIKKLEEYVESNEEINPEIALSLERLINRYFETERFFVKR